MKKNNQKGFTLIELLATIIVLALIMGITTFSIASVIKNVHEKNYNLLIKNISEAAETYYQECKYTNNTGIDCSDDIVSLGELLKYGYIKTNDSKNSNILYNSNDNENINNCEIKITSNNGRILIEDLTKSGSCPPNYEGVK